MSKALPERQLEIEGLLRELESLEGQLDDLAAWASSTRNQLEHSPEEPPPKVANTDRQLLFMYRVEVQRKLLIRIYFVSVAH